MVADGRDLLRVAPWVSFAPGIAIGLAVLGFNLVGDALREAFDPKLRPGAEACRSPPPRPRLPPPSRRRRRSGSAEFPWADETIYLNHASIGPLPERTRLALEAFNRAPGDAVPAAGPRPVRHPGRVAPADRPAAVAPRRRRSALTVNTGFGLGVVARALPLEPGDVVLVSDREFPGQRLSLAPAAEKPASTVELVPTTAAGWPDEARLLERLADPRVRVLAVSLVQFSNGYRVDLAALSAATRRTGAWLVVDAIQAIGQVPVDLSRVDRWTCWRAAARNGCSRPGGRASCTCGGS